MSKNGGGARLKNSKLTILGVARKRLALTEEDWRAILLRYGGHESARALNQRGFTDVMDHLRTLGFESTPRQASFGERDGMASPGQVAAIRRLWSEVAAEPTAAGLNHWLERFGVSALRFLDAPRASKAIGALRLWKARREASSDGA